MMKKSILLAAALTGIFLLAGCQNRSHSEEEQLKQQIAQLEQQVTALEQQTKESAAETENIPDNSAAEAPAAQSDAEATVPADIPADPVENTTTLESLTTQVDAYVEKANAATASGTDSENMAAFFSLKQEGESLEDDLDRFEDELEYQYRQGQLTRDEYKSLERQLDDLDDQLDRAEDTLEWTFGIRD